MEIVAASNAHAAAITTLESNECFSRVTGSRSRGRVTGSRWTLLLLLLCAIPCPALAKNKDSRITKLTDVNFGTIGNLGIDAVQSQSVCVFVQGPMKPYTVTASGTGSGAAFTLASGARTLAYDVQWNGATGQMSGTQLTPNVPASGFNATATNETCATGPASDASLIVILRAAALSSATAGAYSGTLTLVVAFD